MKTFPPPIWTLALLAALYFLSELPVFGGLPEWRTSVTGVIVMVIGLLGPFISIPHFLSVGTQVQPTSPENNKLVVSGLYALTRNPMYLGMVIFALGAAMWFGRPLMYLAPLGVFAITNWVFIPFEEAKMRRQFGAEFDAYCKRVRRWI